MTHNEAIQHFRTEYGNSTNFMTPEVLSLHHDSELGLVWEVSRGRGIEGERIYGVTVVQVKNGKVKRRRDLSEMFHSLSAAQRHIDAFTGRRKEEPAS